MMDNNALFAGMIVANKLTKLGFVQQESIFNWSLENDKGHTLFVLIESTKVTCASLIPGTKTISFHFDEADEARDIGDWIGRRVDKFEKDSLEVVQAKAI